MQHIFRNRWLPYLLLLPTMIILVLFLYYPILSTFQLSLYQAAPNGIDLTYVGTDNFGRLLDPKITTNEKTGAIQFKNEYFLVLGRTLLFSLAIVVGGLGLSLAIANLANQKIRGIRIYRTLLIWPYAISPAIAGVVFLFMFNPVGVVSSWFNTIFHVRPNWLGDPVLTPLLVIMASIWKNLGYNVIFYLAGLQNVGGDLLEAAAIDGANRWQRFWRITFPLLSPFTFFLLITNLTYAFFDIFGTVDVLAGPGPNNSTTVLIYNLYIDLNVNHSTGMAAAQSVLLFALVAALTIFQFRTTERGVYYGA
ncbi:MAG: sugar ABC transporter permease [Anaerolineae bacterium]|nr:sugar ABC transporter permease [Anaerolineae bacterium]